MLYKNFNRLAKPTNEDCQDKEIKLSYTLDQLTPHYRQLETLFRMYLNQQGINSWTYFKYGVK